VEQPNEIVLHRQKRSHGYGKQVRLQRAHSECAGLGRRVGRECRKTSAGRAYLQIVESRRDGDQVRQQVIATLGRFTSRASGQPAA
jgi:hypothetical protein